MSGYYTAIIFLSVFSMVIMELCIQYNNMLSKNEKRLFGGMYFLIIICAFSEWMSLYLDGKPELRSIHIVIKAIELSGAPFIGVLCAAIIGKTKWTKYMVIIMAVHALLVCISTVSGFIFYVDEVSHYFHGEWYWLYILSYSLGAIYFVVEAIGSMKRFQYSGATVLVLIVLFQASGIIIQMADNNLKVDWIALAISGMLVYIFHNDMIQQTDPMTSLLNRRGYETCLNYIQEKVIILFFDVDCFKYVNDTHGHTYGDYCLKEIGAAIRKAYSGSGKCFRIGGDEFCVILHKGLDQVERLNAYFLQIMEQKRFAEPRMPYVSLGYALFDPKSGNIQDAVAEADEKMYLQKQKSRKQH